MNRLRVNSSSINYVEYDPQSESLEIEFVSGGVYRYIKVPQSVYDSFMSASSKGRYYHDYIKGKYTSTQIR